MGRVSVKKNKTLYQTTREELGFTREKASELIGTLTAERLERIENEKSFPHPDEVLAMSVAYKRPRLCNHYCANSCPIGQEYVPEVQNRHLSEIVLGLLASLNSVQKWKDRLIEITADGEIGDEEITDFVNIQNKLEEISLTVESLQLWSQRMLATGKIDAEQYQENKNMHG